MSDYKTGKLEPREDKRTLRMRDYLTLPWPPASRSWDHGITSWGMMKNDIYGDCTVAALGHAIQETTANASTEVTLPDPVIVQTYFTLTGGPDSGLVELDVLKYWQHTGVGGHQNRAYAQCSTTSIIDVKACVDLFGFAYIGFVVPNNVFDQFNAGQPWDNSGSPTQSGHAVIVVDYDDAGGTCVTWGRLQRFTWAWWQKFVDEAWGVVLPEWIAANGLSPSGLNLDQLLADVQQLQQAPTPDPVPSWQPDPAVVAGLAWERDDAAWALGAYQASGGDLSGVKTAQHNLASYSGSLDRYFVGQTKRMPKTPGAPRS